MIKVKSVKNRLLHLKNRSRAEWMKLSSGSIEEISLKELIEDVSINIKSPILDDICMPPYFKTFSDHNDYEALMKIVVSHRPSLVLELGTAHGNTTANIINNLPTAKVVTVNAPFDLQTGDIVTFDLGKDEIGRVYKQHGFEDSVKQVFQDTLQLDLTEFVEKKSVDLCIIDACHDYEYVVNDFYKTIDYVKKGGIVLFHDTHPSLKRHLANSYAACCNLNAEGYNIKHLKNTWWGVYLKDQ